MVKVSKVVRAFRRAKASKKESQFRMKGRKLRKAANKSTMAET